MRKCLDFHTSPVIGTVAVVLVDGIELVRHCDGAREGRGQQAACWSRRRSWPRRPPRGPRGADNEWRCPLLHKITHYSALPQFFLCWAKVLKKSKSADSSSHRQSRVDGEERRPAALSGSASAPHDQSQSVRCSLQCDVLPARLPVPVCLLASALALQGWMAVHRHGTCTGRTAANFQTCARRHFLWTSLYIGVIPAPDVVYSSFWILILSNTQDHKLNLKLFNYSR